MTEEMKSRLGKLRTMTPLLVIASFVTLSEIVAGLAASKATGTVQLIFTLFAVLFPIAVAGAFFAVLWHRPYVLYGPTEYGDGADVTSFVGAMRPVPSLQLGAPAQASPVEEEPSSETAAASIAVSEGQEKTDEAADWFRLWQEKRYDEAAKNVLARGAQGELDEALARALAGSIYLQKNWAEGLAYFEGVFKSYPAEATAYEWLASSLVRAQDFDKAASTLDRGLKAGADRTSLTIAKARLVADEGRVDDAVGLLRSLETAQGKVSVPLAVAQILLNADRVDEAISSYESALDLDPNSESALFALAKIYSARSERAAALSCYKRLLTIDPKNTTYHTQLGNLYLELELPGKALSAYETANELAQGSEAWILANIGNLLKNKGFGPTAARYLEQAIALDPKSAYAAERLSIALNLISHENEEESALLKAHEIEARRRQRSFPDGAQAETPKLLGPEHG